VVSSKINMIDSDDEEENKKHYIEEETKGEE
jgi:hypothetical protein